MALDLHLDGVQLAADIARIENATDQVRGVLLKVEVLERMNRGEITIQALGRTSTESFRTDRLENDSGKEMLRRANELVGRLVRVYKELELVKSQDGDGPGGTRKVRMVTHLVDLGPADGQIPEKDAKDMVIQAVRGDKDKAAAAWQAAGLPASGPVDQDQLESALSRIGATGEHNDGEG